MPSLAYENAESRHRYILDLFDSHTADIAGLQERCLSSLLPSIAESLSLSERGVARARAYLGDDPVTTFRFLRRWKYDHDAAAAALQKTLTWRLESDLDLLWASSLEPEYTERPLFFFHPSLKDRFGRPCGVLNLKEVRRTEDGSLDGLKEFIAWAWEVARRWLADLSIDAMPTGGGLDPGGEGAKQRPEAKVQLSVIVDLKDAGMSNLEMELLPYFMDLLKNHFPGMVGTIFIMHYSWIYGGMWQVAKRILPSQALDRIIFPSSNDELMAFFDPAHLLVQHGGKVEYDYSLRNNEIFQRFGRPVHHHPTPTSSSSLLPAISLSRSSSSPALSRRSSFESIHDVFFSAAATPSSSQPTTPPCDTAALPSGLTSRPSWLSMTSLPAAGGGAGLGEAIRRNQRKKGRRPAHREPRRTSSALGLALGEPSASIGGPTLFADADASPAHSSSSDDDEDDPETALVEDAVGLARTASLRDFRLHLPRGTRDLSSGPPSSDSSSSSTITAAQGSRPGSRHSSRVSSRAVSREPSPRRTFFSPRIVSKGFEATTDGDPTLAPRHDRKRDLLRTLSYLAALRVLALNRELRWQLALVLSAVEQTFRLRRLASFGHRVAVRISGVVQEVKEEGQNARARRKGVKWVEGEKGDRDVHPRSSRQANSLVTSASHRRSARLSSHPSAHAAHAMPEISSSVRAVALVFVFLVVRSTWFVSFVESLTHVLLAPGRMLVNAERRAADAVTSTTLGGAGSGPGKPRRRKRDWVLARVGLRLP